MSGRIVWAIFLYKENRGAAYDLQAIAEERETADRLAALIRSGDPSAWVALSTGRHWVAHSDRDGCVTLRISETEVDRIRDDRDSDPPELGEEMRTAYAEAFRRATEVRHGDSHS